jgi:hypothetical protein
MVCAASFTRQFDSLGVGMKTGSFLAVIALSLAILAGQLVGTVKAQGHEGACTQTNAQSDAAGQTTSSTCEVATKEATR